MKGGKYHGRQDFARVWALASKKMHLEMLARPASRRLEPDPNPKYWRQVPFRIEKATLKHQASKRLKLLSQVPPGKFTEKFTAPIPPEHYVHEYNLSYIPSPRIEELSKPRDFVKKKDKKKQGKKVIRKSTTKKKSQKIASARKEWLDLRAVPRQLPPPPPIPKWVRKTKPLPPEEREMRIAILAQPMARYLIRPTLWNPYEVSRKARRAKASKRILELAQTKELPEEAKLDLKFKPFTIKKSALKYKASKRIVELSEPVQKRKAVDMDVKEDAFTVPRRALKAVCSKRTKELARPIVRKGVD